MDNNVIKMLTINRLDAYGEKNDIYIPLYDTYIIRKDGKVYVKNKYTDSILAIFSQDNWDGLYKLYSEQSEEFEEK